MLNRQFVVTPALLLCLLAPLLHAQNVPQVRVYPFKRNIPLNAEFNDFHRTLADWSMNQTSSGHFRLIPADSATGPGKGQTARAFIRGRFDSLAGREYLIMEVLDSAGSQPATLKCELYSRDRDVVLDLAYLKIRAFFQTTLFGTLEVRTRPMEAKVWINGLLYGTTPLELVLTKERYGLKIGKTYFRDLTDTLVVLPGQRLSREYSLQFEGANPRPYFYTGFALTILAVASKLYENKLHNEYRNLGPYLDDDIYDRKFKAYRNMNYVSVSLIDISSICYGIGLYCVIKNRVTRKSLDSE